MLLQALYTFSSRKPSLMLTSSTFPHYPVAPSMSQDISQLVATVWPPSQVTSEQNEGGQTLLYHYHPQVPLGGGSRKRKRKEEEARLSLPSLLLGDLL